jgi:glycosyltransferase involved in cell wall biosynthesis
VGCVLALAQAGATPVRFWRSVVPPRGPVSHFLADELRLFYQVPNEKIHAVPNGVSHHAFDGFIDSGEVKGRYGIAPSAPTIFALGRMTVQKGMDMLVEAVPMVLASYPEARFVILGEGPEKQAVVRKAQELGAAGAIVFLNSLPAGRSWT